MSLLHTKNFQNITMDRELTRKHWKMKDCSKFNKKLN